MRKYAAEEGISEAEALESGLKEKQGVVRTRRRGLRACIGCPAVALIFVLKSVSKPSRHRIRYKREEK